PVLAIVEDAPSSHRFRRAFAAALTLKDLRIAVAMGDKLGLDLTAGTTAIKAFEKVDGDPRTKAMSTSSTKKATLDIRTLSPRVAGP
ncbi:3-hydroxyisobutyrate dehydrogenase, partial [Fusarium albosuccineum]